MRFTSKYILLAAFIPVLWSSVSAQQNLAKLVNPFVGTGGHGHTFPGAVVPFGMVQLSPDTRVDGSWDGCSGYHYSDSVIYGFSHTHLSGTGISDWGDMMLMPVMGSQIQFSPKEYSSKFSHQKENASAGYYRVHLDDENIDVELTTTTRVGFHRYTFHQKGEAQVILDLLHRDKLLDGSIHIVNQTNNRVIEGFRRSKAWAPNQQVYFRMEFSKPYKQHAIVSNDSMQTKGGFVFDVNKEDQLLVKVSISSVDVDGARKNMEAELQHWNFDKVKVDAETLWNKELNTIQVKGGTPKQQTIFYTALYHCFIHPSIANDVDGRYLGRDFMIHQADGFDYYTVFSLWDTFRALHPLFNLVQRERNLDFIKTFLAQYQHSGRLPMWELSSNETNCMIGYHSVSVIADAYAKGIRGFDVDLAIKACLDATKYNDWAIPVFHQKGFLEAEDEHESVSKTLEYAYDDWCITQFIRDSKRSVPEYASLLQSSKGWQHLYNSQTGFFQPRSNGGWYQPFNPNEVNNHYIEANAWQYSLFVPHDIDAFQQLLKPSTLESRLDALFNASEKMDGRNQVDITGMIGQYAHGNEPSHNFAYLYAYAGKPEKMNQRVQQVMKDLYDNAPDGLSGNEDCGQMSAWYVFSAMGFYPVCPGKNEYVFNQSIFDEVRINGKLIDKKSLPFYQYKTNDTQVEFNIAPIIQSSSNTFKDSLQLTVISLTPKHPMVFKKYDIQSGKEDSSVTERDSVSIVISKSTNLTASLFQKPYTTVSSSFYKKPNVWSATVKHQPNKQYAAGGSEALIDGIYGYQNWRKGNWQGYQSVDVEVIIDLKESKNIKLLKSSYMQDSRSWILFPKEVAYYVSSDGVQYTLVGKQYHSISPLIDSVMVQKFGIQPNDPVNAQYVKVVATNFGQLPVGHQGFGGDAFIFVDEVEIE